MGSPIDFTQVIRGASGQSTGGGAIDSFISGLNSRPVAKIDPSTINDPHVLQNALKTGQISRQDFLTRFQQITPTVKPKGGNFSSGNLGKDIASSLGTTLYNATVQPAVVAAQKAVSQAKYLSQPTATPQQRNALITNQKKAVSLPSYTNSVNTVGPKNISVSGRKQAAAMANQGASEQEITQFLKNDAANVKANNLNAVNAALTIAPAAGSLAKIGAKEAAGTKLAQTLNNIKGNIPRPRSALDKLAPAEATGKPTTAAAPSGAKVSLSETKTAPTASTQVTEQITKQGSVSKNVKPAETPPAAVQTTEPLAKPTGPEKVSGSAAKVESKAVEANLTKEFEGKATYASGSYKSEAQKAVKLAQTDPQTARAIAMGEKPADNVLHESAVFHAVKENAIKAGDGETLRQLAQSPRHTQISEAAQKLGSEGYNASPTDPVSLIRQVADARVAAVKRKLGKAAPDIVEKTAKETQTAVKQAMPKVSRQDWHEFVTGLQCK